MLQIDFTQIEKPFGFIRELMPNDSEEEIQEAHRRLCEFLNIRIQFFNQLLKEGKIELDG